MNYIQPQILKYWLTITENVILDYIMRAFSWANPIDIDWKTYVRLHGSKIIEDLPSLWITTSQWLNKHINNLINMWLIDKKQVSNAPHYCITEKTKEYEFAGSKQLLHRDETNVSKSINDSFDYSNIIDSNIKYINIPIDQIKRKTKSLAENLERLLSFLNGKETDLIDVSYREIIDLWNWYSSDYRLPKVNTNNMDSVMVKSINREWIRFRWVYTKEEFNLWLKNYLNNIKHRKPDWKIDSYYDHRFSLYQFLTQRNWIKKFMAQG